MVLCFCWDNRGNNLTFCLIADCTINPFLQIKWYQLRKTVLYKHHGLFGLPRHFCLNYQVQCLYSYGGNSKNNYNNNLMFTDPWHFLISFSHSLWSLGTILWDKLPSSSAHKSLSSSALLKPVKIRLQNILCRIITNKCTYLRKWFSQHFMFMAV